MVEIKFSHDALSDLKGIKAYIANELLNERAALNTVSDIMKHSRQLVEFPESGAPLSSIVQLDTNYRYLVCGSYTVFYRSEKNTVYIDRVIYSRRDFMRILFDSN